MRRITNCVLAAAVLTVACLHAQEPDWELIKRGVTQIKADQNLAAGIVSLASPGLIQIVTVAQAVRGAQRITILFPAELDRPYEAQLLPGLSDDLDLAVLEIRPQADHLPINIPPYGIRESPTFQAGEPLCIFNKAWTNLRSTLTVPNLGKELKTVEYPSVAPAVTYPGSPVFDGNGQLVGIQMENKQGQANSSAIKIGTAVDALVAAGHNLPNFVLASLDGKWQLAGYGPKDGASSSDPVDFVIKGQTCSMKLPNFAASAQGTCIYDGASLTVKLTGIVNDPSAPPLSASVTTMLGVVLEQLNTMLFKEKLLRQQDGSFTTELNMVERSMAGKDVVPDIPKGPFNAEPPKPVSDPEPPKTVTIRLSRNRSSSH